MIMNFLDKIQVILYILIVINSSRHDERAGRTTRCDSPPRRHGESDAERLLKTLLRVFVKLHFLGSEQKVKVRKNEVMSVVIFHRASTKQGQELLCTPPEWLGSTGFPAVRGLWHGVARSSFARQVQLVACALKAPRPSLPSSQWSSPDHWPSSGQRASKGEAGRQGHEAASVRCGGRGCWPLAKAQVPPAAASDPDENESAFKLMGCCPKGPLPI